MNRTNLLKILAINSLLATIILTIPFLIINVYQDFTFWISKGIFLIITVVFYILWINKKDDSSDK